MSRYYLFLAAIIGMVVASSGGCRGCSSCHDYDPPVANSPYACPCGCNGCGYGGCGSCGCSSCGSCNSCGTCGGGQCGCTSCGGGQCSCNGSGPAYASPGPSPAGAS